MARWQEKEGEYIMADFMNNGFNLDGGVSASNDKGGFVFDLTGVEESTGFEVIPKGTYPAIVDELTFGESKKGDPMITVKYKLVDCEYENRVIFDYLMLGGKGAEFGLPKLKKFLTRVCPEVNIGAFNPTEFDEEGIAVGKECRLTLGIQTQKSGEYKGEKRNTVKDVLQPETGSFI